MTTIIETREFKIVSISNTYMLIDSAEQPRLISTLKRCKNLLNKLLISTGSDELI